MSLNEYDINQLKESCIKFSREYIYDEDGDERPSHILYKLYLNDKEYKSIYLNPYITDQIYIFDESEFENFVWNKETKIYERK